MAIYAIGDIQGCYPQLKKLLQKLKFSSDKDQLWFAGDIVNRGPESLNTIRFIKSLEDNAITVLGNHDLHLLAMAHGRHKQGKKDTVQEILDAPDSEQLLNWLVHRPLMYYQKENNVCLVHAGLHPLWTKDQALNCAKEVEKVLRSSKAHEFFHHMYGDKPSGWSDNLSGWDRLRFITNCFTRMRYINDNMKLRLKEKGSPGKQPADIHPWFEFKRKTDDLNIVFGHWSTLKDPQIATLFPLDTGCLWGGKLTALKINSDLNLNKRTNLIAVKCPENHSFD
ncbi:Bis(5'-nucleosyl)-tetraphosphatase, symmetrical [hydrothermal vent metagenome]|uniref:bis(5'-nucleosyl)-tetraphosphatase (symmetrical) n=1 Tax=hydrothermal vent metagenome TaxID=652676 RepID=A0A3B0XDE7_9ZZZZ